MIIVGWDDHPSFQQIAFVDTETDEVKEERLTHREAAEGFYRSLAARGQQVRAGMEASGHAVTFRVPITGEIPIFPQHADAERAAACCQRLPVKSDGGYYLLRGTLTDYILGP